MESRQSESFCTQQTFALFEDNLDEQPCLVVLDDLLQRIEAYSPDTLACSLELIEQARQAGHWIAFAGHYEMGLALEPRLNHLIPSAHNEPLLQAWVFRRRQFLQGSAVESWWQNVLNALSPAEREAAILSNTVCWDEARYTHAVEHILDLIRQGDCYQVNLTFPTHGLACGHPLALFARLRAMQAVRHGVFIKDGNSTILSRSPELFVERTGTTLRCRPMKGTAPRYPQQEQDAESARQLLASPKERAENLMIVDLIRNDLGRLAPPGAVHVNRLFELETYRTVFQLTSSIAAEDVNAPLASILKALFPCGSVTGAPKIRAMEIIAALEDSTRGIYCGALGWVAPTGDFSLNVPIRTLLLDDSGRYQLNVGSGIVADAEPASEYRECLSKLGFVRNLSEDLELIETFAWDERCGYTRLEPHLARLNASAQQLGFALNLATITDALESLSRQLPAKPHRVRLSLRRNGEFALSSNLQPPLPDSPQYCALAPFSVSSKDPRLGHKTSARGFYDNALRQAMEQGLFDLVFCNERQELCEGARSTLFLEVGEGPLLTPALCSGVLPGILRADLLSKGLAVEAVLPIGAIYHAKKIWLGNSLRGLTEVHLAQ